MSKLKESIKSPHIQIALATGISILVLAYFSKKILPEPLSYLQLALPPFFATVFEALLNKYPDKKFCTTWYWVAAVLLCTAIVIVFNAV